MQLFKYSLHDYIQIRSLLMCALDVFLDRVLQTEIAKGHDTLECNLQRLEMSYNQLGDNTARVLLQAFEVHKQVRW